MAKAKSGGNEEKEGDSPSQLIDARIEELGDWRGETLAHIRKLIKEADPDVVEEWKWRGVPVWYHDGMICTGETYKNVVKMTFAKGASLNDLTGLFNSSLDGNTRRAIDIHEDDKINEKALKALIRAAVALNTSSTTGVGCKMPWPRIGFVTCAQSGCFFDLGFVVGALDVGRGSHRLIGFQRRTQGAPDHRQG
jgi:hypothetical protein